MADTAKDPSTIPTLIATDTSETLSHLEPTVNANANNDEHDEEVGTDFDAWDDDAFEPAPLARAISEGTEADTSTQASGDGDDEWHVSIAAPAANATLTSSAAAQDRESSRQALLSLGTPAAKKKLRCMGCTRPLPDQEASGPALCPRCK